MAAISNKNYHVRSNSLPTEPHPVFSQAEEHLNRLRASETTTSAPSISIASMKLRGVVDLHDAINELLELTLTRQDILRECCEEKRIIADLLQGSVRLLDICGIARDLVAETKEFVQELRSILRRQGDKMGNIVSSDDFKNCLVARKKTVKAVKKTLKSMDSKKSERKQEKTDVLGLFREVEIVTSSTVERLLKSLEGSKSPLKVRSFSYISKLSNSRRVEEEERLELQMVDFALSSIVGNKTIKDQNLQHALDKLEACAGVLEEDVEILYRRLLKTRVSLLNVFNH